jgi:hypothetical protein
MHAAKPLYLERNGQTHTFNRNINANQIDDVEGRRVSWNDHQGSF